MPVLSNVFQVDVILVFTLVQCVPGTPVISHLSDDVDEYRLDTNEITNFI